MKGGDDVEKPDGDFEDDAFDDEVASDDNELEEKGSAEIHFIGFNITDSNMKLFIIVLFDACYVKKVTCNM